MRVVIAILLAGGGLGVSIHYARIHYENRPGDAPMDRLVDENPRVRAAHGEEYNSLGVALEGYRELTARYPDDLEAARNQVRTGLKLGAVAFGQPNLPRFVQEQIQVYLDRRKEIDPDGSLLRDSIRAWIDLRLGVDEESAPIFFYAQAAVVIFLAARDVDRGHEMLLEYTKRGPFYGQFFPYVRRAHPGWAAVRPLVEHYLKDKDPLARLEAGVTLLDYHNLFGVGEDLVTKHVAAIRSTMADCHKRWTGRMRDSAFRTRAPALLLAFGLLAGPAERRALEVMRDVDYPELVDLLRMARVSAGLVPLSRYELGGEEWKLLTTAAQEHYFRAAVHLFARLSRRVAAESDPGRKADLKARLEEARAVAEAGLVSEQTDIVVYCLQGLVANDPFFAKTLPPRFVEGRGVPSLYAASLMELDDPVDVLLPGIISAAPDHSALAAVSLLDVDGPLPVQGPAR